MTDLEKKAQHISARARTARENSGLSQGQAAKKLGLSRPSLTESEAGRRKISAAELTAMAAIYGVSVSWLACEGAEESDPDRDRIELAARDLAKLKKEDLESVMTSRVELARQALKVASNVRIAAKLAATSPLCVYDLIQQHFRDDIELRFQALPSLEGMYSKTAATCPKRG
jgi:transcriptional regulator with XRE-family HTH domain